MTRSHVRVVVVPGHPARAVLLDDVTKEIGAAPDVTIVMVATTVIGGVPRADAIKARVAKVAAFVVAIAASVRNRRRWNWMSASFPKPVAWKTLLDRSVFPVGLIPSLTSRAW